MSTYCAPIRHADWHELEPEELWYEVESPKGDVLWILEMIDQSMHERAIEQIARLHDEALGDVHSLEADPSLAGRFREQADKWARETQHLSSPTQRIMHPSYQAILGMGQDHKQEIIRFLLLDLKQHRRAWFWALSYLAQDNPISQKDAGKMDKMIKAWVDWGKKKGLL